MFFVDFLGWFLKLCYQIVPNYGVAIILFTLLSKIILLPVSIWVQKNSIKMVKMQPEINRIKIKYFGDKDTIAEKQTQVYKKHHYHALASLVPLVIQILLLIGIIEIVKNPVQYIGVETLDYNFLGFDLRWIAVETGGLAFLIPLIAGLSAFLLCLNQNRQNALQAEQGKAMRYGTMLFSVGLSLYLGFFVTAGVALYWIASNLFSILQQWLLNLAINPKKYVDYAALEASTQELRELQELNKAQKRTPEQIKREKADYKRFFSIANKKLVFYSENSGFYKYYQGIIDYLLKNTNLTIHYITSDPDDQIFQIAETEPRVKPYYIGEKKLITLMMKMDADVVAMTMTDLDNYHIKRSYVRKDTEYIYLPHDMNSQNLVMRKHSTDHYDSVLVTGPHQHQEAEKVNQLEHLDRQIIDLGYPLLDNMITDYQNSKPKKQKQKTVMIAPSWQKDNIIDLCLEDILESLANQDYRVVVRPHPQQVRHMKEYFDRMKEKYSGTNIEIQTDFSSNNTVFNADILITDWSGIAWEYAFTTEKPVISVDTPMKIMNPDYQELGLEPFNIWARSKIGEVVSVEDTKNIDKIVSKLLKNPKKYRKEIVTLKQEYVYNLGSSAEVGAEYIIERIQAKINERKNQ